MPLARWHAPPNRIRHVVCIGDSITYAPSMPRIGMDRSWVDQLAAALDSNRCATGKRVPRPLALRVETRGHMDAADESRRVRRRAFSPSGVQLGTHGGRADLDEAHRDDGRRLRALLVRQARDGSLAIPRRRRTVDERMSDVSAPPTTCSTASSSASACIRVSRSAVMTAANRASHQSPGSASGRRQHRSDRDRRPQSRTSAPDARGVLSTVGRRSARAARRHSPGPGHGAVLERRATPRRGKRSGRRSEGLVRRVAPYADVLLISPFEQRPPRRVGDAVTEAGSHVISSETALFLPTDSRSRISGTNIATGQASLRCSRRKRRR